MDIGWRALALLALFVPLALASAASDASLSGSLVDEDGAPVPGAIVRLHTDGTFTRTDAAGWFTIAAPPRGDVLVAAMPGFEQVAVAVADGASQAESSIVMTRAPSRPPAVPIAIDEAIEPAFAVAGQAPWGTAATSLRLPFRVDEGASAARARIEWSPEAVAGYGGVTLSAEMVHIPSGIVVARTVGETPLRLDAPPSALSRHAGTWELVVRPADSAARRVDVTAEVVVEEGVVRAKRVLGAPPLVADGAGTERADAPATMDVLNVTITNETRESLEVRLDLAQVGTMEAARLPYAHWVVRWERDGEVQFASITALSREMALVRGTPLDFSVGRCSTVCQKLHDVEAVLEPGTPGSIRIPVPKSYLGEPRDGVRLEALSALVYESAEDVVVAGQADAAHILLVEATDAGGPYVLGVDEFRIPERELLTLLADDGAIAAQADRHALGKAGPFLAFSAAAAGALAVCAAWVITPSRPRRRSAIGRAGRSAYEKIRLLGEGASGRVWLARHTTNGTWVAYKEGVHEHIGARGRLRREAQVLARIDHPHVVRVLELEELSHGVAVVMEYLPGGSLQDRLDRQGAFSLLEATAYWRDVLAGLAAAHEAGVVHRDVKPANTLVAASGEAKLADFGLASGTLDITIGADSTIPRGTPAYMAPEQIRGEEPTQASDVYAAAAMAFRLISGRPIVDLSACRSAWDVLIARAGQSPTLPLAEAPSWVNELLARCLAEEPASRPTAEEARSIIDLHLAASGAVTATCSADMGDRTEGKDRTQSPGRRQNPAEARTPASGALRRR